jgi:predicted nucleic acid-binding protein
MKRYFADAYFFFAWWNRRDRAHPRVQAFLDQFDGYLVTTRWVLMEVADGFATTPARRMVRALLDDLASDPMISIIEAEHSLHERGLALYDSRPDKEWSLTDCISFIVMTDSELTEALTGDRHFEQAGFRAILSGD